MTVGGREGESGEGREVERWKGSAKLLASVVLAWLRSPHCADYVTLCLATAFAGLSGQSFAAGPRSLCLERRECRRRTPP